MKKLTKSDAKQLAEKENTVNGMFRDDELLRKYLYESGMSKYSNYETLTPDDRKHIIDTVGFAGYRLNKSVENLQNNILSEINIIFTKIKNKINMKTLQNLPLTIAKVAVIAALLFQALMIIKSIAE